jgi:hypothetical protein
MEFCQYLVIEVGLETINATASTSNNVKKFFVTQQEQCLCSLLTLGLKNLWKSQRYYVNLQRARTVQFSVIYAKEHGNRKELVVKQGILCVLLFLLRFSDLEVECYALLAIALLQFNA